MTDPSAPTAALLARAAAGDQRAWDALVGRHSGLIAAVARGFRLGSADVDDVVQTTWLRLTEHLGRIDEPERLPGWLATTARRECLRLLRRAGRERPVGDDAALDRVDDGAAAVDAALLTDEQNRAVWHAFLGLGDRCQQLLRIAVAEPEHYAQVAEALGMPMGSIGPTRRRCLERLKELLGAEWSDATGAR